MKFVMFILIALAVWRISSLVAHEDGPYEVFEKFRHLVGVEYDEESKPYGRNQFAKGLTCIWCNSIWFGVIVTIAYARFPEATVLFCIPFALSTVAIIVESIVE